MLLIQLLVGVGVSLAHGPTPANAQSERPNEGEYLYRVVMVRAAPGGLLDLIELYREERDLLEDAQEPLPFWMRHTQGDQWDLMFLYPMGSFHEYFEPQREGRRLASGQQKGLAEADLLLQAMSLTSWRDELFVRGPDPSVLEEEFSENGYYHVEMFVALPGRQGQLLEERRMENHYLRELGRPENLIFRREAGGPWDSFTLGFYRDQMHWAASGAIPAADRERAARAAGFQGAERIGSYMRSLIAYHRDTLLTAIR
jgi:hypothetical protein